MRGRRKMPLTDFELDIGRHSMKICLCGSTRFKQQYVEANKLLTSAGYLVYSVAFWERGPTGPDCDEWTKQKLDLVHLRKIMESDMILVVGSDDGKTPYIGESTRREVFWARMLQRPVYFDVEGAIVMLIDPERYAPRDIGQSRRR
jgi:hypothetical protein